MKTTPFKLFITLSFLFIASGSNAQTRQESLIKLFELSGITKQLSELPEVVKAGFYQSLEQQKQQGVELPEEIVSSILESAERTFLPSIILEEINNSVDSVITDGEITRLLNWYSSELGRKITLAEEQASTPEAINQMFAQHERLMSDTDRVNTASRIDQIIGITDMAMQIQEFSGMAVYTAITSAVMPGQPLNLELYKQQMESLWPQIRQEMEYQVLLSLVYTYQNIDDETLAIYEGFLNKSTTIKFNQAIIKGMIKGENKINTNWAIDLSNTLNQRLSEPNRTGT